jgi:hypothetical protein
MLFNTKLTENKKENCIRATDSKEVKNKEED